MPKRLTAVLLFVVILLVPLLLAFVWGSHLADDVYPLLLQVQNLAGGTAAEFSSESLIYGFFVTLFVRIGVEPAQAAAVISALGWSAAAFAFVAIGRRLEQTAALMVSALLLCFNPVVITTLGTPVSWIIALFWWLIALLLHRRFILALIALVVLILVLLPYPVDLPIMQPTLAAAFGWSLLIFFAGIGAAYVGKWLAARTNSPLSQKQLTTASLLTLFILVGAYQLVSIDRLLQGRPESRWILEEDIARWLQANTPAGSQIGAGEKIGYLANRPVIPTQPIIASSMNSESADILEDQPLDYLIANSALPWQMLARSRWFQLNYQPAAEFEDDAVAEAPYTIWSYAPPPSELGYAHALNARVPDYVRILGYQIDQHAADPDNEAVVSLYLETPLHSKEPATPFTAKIRLLSPADFSTLAEWDFVLPGSIAVQDWQPGQEIQEQLIVDLPPGLDPGAYPFNLSLTKSGAAEFWPISMDNDLKRLDRIQLGHLLLPAAYDPDTVQQREAYFADDLKLLGFASTAGLAGETLEITLFWQAENPVEEDYVVFTHLLDGSGQLVASHDSVPDNGRFPTSSWLPGITIPDTHTIQLPADLPPGDYQVQVGLYAPESGERLPVVAADGSVPPNNSFPLTTITVP